MVRKSLLLIFAALLLASGAPAQEATPNSPAKKSPWTPDDIVFSESATQFRISPDGKWAVWIKSAGSKDKDGRVSNLYLSSLTEKKEIQLTRGEDEVSNPRWSPSGERIAFLSTRALPKPNPKAAHMQLWMMDAFGGEPWNVTEFVRGIRQFEWLDDNTILFSDNYPANGITFDQAKAYCEWLSKNTGRAYRLPKESEVASLYKPRTGENTLDYWAGYALNPEDAQRLDAKLKLLPGNAPLLREVGSFSGEGEDGQELVFDLDGNVAEWVVAADGTGKTLGGSADRPADPKARYRPADAAYTGFRVVYAGVSGK